MSEQAPEMFFFFVFFPAFFPLFFPCFFCKFDGKSTTHVYTHICVFGLDECNVFIAALWRFIWLGDGGARQVLVSGTQVFGLSLWARFSASPCGE